MDFQVSHGYYGNWNLIFIFCSSLRSHCSGESRRDFEAVKGNFETLECIACNINRSIRKPIYSSREIIGGESAAIEIRRREERNVKIIIRSVSQKPRSLNKHVKHLTPFKKALPNVEVSEFTARCSVERCGFSRDRESCAMGRQKRKK